MSRKKSRKTPKRRTAQSKAELSRKRGHIPLKVLESHLAKMPRHMHELARLIKQRKAAGE